MSACSSTNNSIHHWLQAAQAQRCRYLVVLEGSKEWAANLLVASGPVVVFSDDSSFSGNMGDRAQLNVAPWSSAKQMLGQELGHVALDLHDKFDIEKTCAISGCVAGGNVLFLMLDASLYRHLGQFGARLKTMFSHPSVVYIRPEGVVSRPDLPDSLREKSNDPVNGDSRQILLDGCVTADQNRAVQAVLRVVSGHRRRPLLLTADRGRGKSASMGIAAASLLKKGGKHILVTSPRPANVEILFEQAKQACGLSAESGKLRIQLGDSCIEFVPPDKLLSSDLNCDLLLVDEAAAIPLPMLEQMVGRYSRVCFSSTEHGYEGTGRGFSTRFKSVLDKKAPGWQQLKMEQAIRWTDNDPLERWLFETFLFDAEPVAPPHSGTITFQRFSPQDLVADEERLQQLFGLLISAHYQTSPNDLMQLLGDEEGRVICALSDDTVVGVLLAWPEGGFMPELATDVASGKRRIRGHLLAQSLAGHTGLPEVLESRILRIQRIAVADSLQRTGIGKALVDFVAGSAREQGLDALGTSFGASETVARFWFGLDFEPLRMGVRRDAASGCYSLQMAKPLAVPPAWFFPLRQLFSSNLHHQIVEQFADMSPELVALLWQQTGPHRTPTSEELAQVERFAKGGLGVDLIIGSLVVWLGHYLSTAPPSSNIEPGLALAIGKILQRSSWESLALSYSLRGRKDVESTLRSWIVEKLQ